jgi:hypothetical protein
VNTPEIPALKPYNIALPPFYRPWKTFWGFFIFYFSLWSSKSLSNAKVASPVERVPVILDKELNAPPTEWATKEPVPWAIPLPN